MEQAKNGDVVVVHYTGRLEDGTVFDSSRGRDPIRFTIGDNHIIPGFEEAVVGMAPGESKTEHIPTERAYGPRREDMIIDIERSRLPEELEPKVGESLQIRSVDGRTAPAVIAEIGDESIKIDANHPLAGLDLVFEIELVQID
jgi:FKBP-type peptidyl-prolyl cis-trans isomerase 2